MKLLVKCLFFVILDAVLAEKSVLHIGGFIKVDTTDNILVPRAAILLASATDRDL